MKRTGYDIATGQDLYAGLFQTVLLPVADIMQGLSRMQFYRELMRTQYLSRQELDELRDRRLRDLVRHALRTVPYYEEFARREGFDPEGFCTFADLKHLPVLTKEIIRREGSRLHSRAPRGRVYENRTGGSTGEPLHFPFDATEKSVAWASLMRALAWAGAVPGDRMCVLAGGSLGIGARSRWRSLFNTLSRRLELAAFGLTRDSVGRFAARIRSHQPRVLHGYASTVYLLAKLCQEEGIRDLRFASALTTAEVLLPEYIQLIENQFGCRVFDLYGSAEVNGIAAQCEIRDGYHVFDERVVIESSAQDGSPIEELLVTNLTNYAFPFLRYRSGDAVETATGSCPCGRELGRIARIRGRVFDFILTADGEYLAGEFFPHLFRDFRGFDYYQIRQEEERRVRVLLVKGKDFKDGEYAVLRERLADHLGRGMRIEYDFVDEIPRTAAGKLRVVVSEIT
jgi:phenylacetate-CoA ligase